MGRAKSVNGRMIFVVLAILALAYAPSAAHAWQQGADTTDSNGYYGIYSRQFVTGSVPSTLFFAAVSAFTDTSSVWHAIALIDYSSGSVEVEAEYNDGNYHDTILCTGLSQSTPYGAEIYWSWLNEWLYESSAAGCSTLALVQSGTPTVNSGGSVDMMESNDNTASDFNSNGAYVAFSPALEYFDGVNTWIHSTHADAHVASPPSSLGVGIICVSHKVYTIDVDNYYAPPPSDGGDSTSC